MRRSTTKCFVALCVLFPAFAGSAHAQDTLVWSDEFDGATLDPDNWENQIGDGSAYGLPPGWGNNELQYYTDRPENCYVTDGYLHLVARRESYAGHDYTSARIRSANRQDFLYGRMEARLRLPTGQGIWPAFWMLPTDWVYGGWAASGEIDIMESINTATTVYGTMFFGGEWPGQIHIGGNYSDGTDFSQDFHVYTLEWQPDQMNWYVDDHLYFAATSSDWHSDGAPANPRAPFDQRFHFLLNVAVGGDWPGPPDGSTVFPQELVVDWVRVYDSVGQRPFHGSPLEIPGRIEAEDYDLGGEGVAYHDCDPANQGGAYRPGSGVDIEACSEGGFNVGWMCADEWLEYTVEVATSGPYLVETRVASNSTGGTFHLELDDVDVTGEITVPVTGDWQSWVTVAARATLPAGEHVMRFANSDSPSDEYNINHFGLQLLGDLDRDTDVDLSDLAQLLGSYGTAAGATYDDGDLDDDGDVDLSDLASLLVVYGTDCPQ
jgi:beta-glucanase (GH16 family)